MPEHLLPLFPLDVVLLPGTPLPLHIFEDRYKEMIGEAISRNSEFGIVQAGERGVLNIGCTATVERVVNRYPDGRLDIVVLGRRRFEILLLDQEKEFLRAAVAFFDDEDEGLSPPELRTAALAGLIALQLAAGEEAGPVPDSGDPQLSFKIGYFVEDLAFRQTLLGLRSETERMKQLNAYLPEYAARTRRISHVRKIAPRNGHGFLNVRTDSTEGPKV